MKVIAVSALKGGAGRSTLSALLASGLVRKNRRVLLADCDEPQYSSSSWFSALRANPKAPVIASGIQCARTPSPDRLKAVIEAARAQDYELVIVDCTPDLRPGTVARAALLAADLALVPIAGTPAELWAGEDFAKIIRAAQDATGRPLIARLVWNRVQKRKLLDEVRTVASETIAIEALGSSLGYRAAYAAMLGGETLATLPGASTARREAAVLCREVAALLNL